DRDGFADIADLVVGDDRLLERREGWRGVLPQRNGRHHGADVRRRDDGVHAGPGAGGSGLDRADAAVRHRTAQDHGVQKIFAREGLPWSWIARRPAAPSASIWWTLPGASGSATSSTSVASNPSPASATAAATLAFCG